MKLLLARPLLLSAALLLLSAGLVSEALAQPGPCVVDPVLGNPVEVELHTSAGVIDLELWPNIAPCTINNFLTYANSGRYNGTFIHRAVDSFVIQGGGYAYDSGTQTYSSIPRDPAVVNEPGASNVTATIAMARQSGVVNSATSEFFINLADNSFLDTIDEGFTVFGEVVPPGMTIANDIDALPVLDGRWSLNSALRNVFSTLPLHNLPTEYPGGYGCFDPEDIPETGLSGWTRGLVNQAGNAFQADPVTGGIFYLSAFCDGSGAVGPPSVTCTSSRIVAKTNGTGWSLGAPNMTCDQIAESEESLAARRDDQHALVGPELVELTAVVVPEPGSTALCVTGVIGLVLLQRRRARVR
jgi:cyclophilin family peptidyl-prolyl cis-trans isomerase